MEVEVNWVNGTLFRGTTSVGAEVMINSGPDEGEPTPSPMELVLLGAASCTATDVVLILEKMKQAVSGLRVEAKAQQEPEHPRRFTKIHLHYRVRGRDLAEERVARAISLSEQKYCSALASLKAQVTSSFELLDDSSNN